MRLQHRSRLERLHLCYLAVRAPRQWRRTAGSTPRSRSPSPAAGGGHLVTGRHSHHEAATRAAHYGPQTRERASPDEDPNSGLPPDTKEICCTLQRALPSSCLVPRRRRAAAGCWRAWPGTGWPSRRASTSSAATRTREGCPSCRFQSSQSRAAPTWASRRCSTRYPAVGKKRPLCPRRRGERGSSTSSRWAARAHHHRPAGLRLCRRLGRHAAAVAQVDRALSAEPRRAPAARRAAGRL